MSDNENNLYDGDSEDELLDDGAPSEDPSPSVSVPKSTDKRVRDLQSKADTETARANKAEARLKSLEAAMKDTSAEGSAKSPVGDDAGMAIVLDMARMFAFQQNPKLSEYGISAADLGGGTPSEIAQYATDLIARFEKIETQVRNKVLSENGIAPILDSGTPPPPSRDFSKMSSEDFNKLVEATMRG